MSNLPLIRFSSLLHDDVVHGMSTRRGGCSAAPYNTLNLGMSTADREENVAANRQSFLASLDVTEDRIVFGRLSHGCEVSVFRRDREHEWPVAVSPRRKASHVCERAFFSDGVVSDVPGLVFFMTYADCVPILLLDPVRRVIGLVHAGWRGTALRIASKTVAAMRHHFGCRPEHVIAAIGPSIGQCCYPVSGEVSAAFRAAYGDTAEEFHTGAHLDLWSANRYDLESEGVPCHQIENPELCTACNTHTFFSHRAEDGATGRMGACMGLVA